MVLLYVKIVITKLKKGEKMSYRHDMSKESKKKALLPEGWRPFKITACEEKVSKKGNDMFVFTFTDIETGQDEEVYAIAAQGKRWFLKGILSACGVAAAEDGVYDWDMVDVMNKAIRGYVVHEEEEWINRQGETIVTKKSKINDTMEANEDDRAKADEVPF